MALGCIFRDDFLQSKNSCSIDKKHMTHSDNQYFRAPWQSAYGILESLCCTKKQCAVNFIHRDTLWQYNQLIIKKMFFVAFACKEVFSHLHFGRIAHPFHQDESRKHNADFDGDDQIENNG